jgi:hypothetical protein
LKAKHSSSYGSIHIFIRFWYASQLFTSRIKLFKYIVRTKLKKATEKKKLPLAQTNKIYAKVQNHVHWIMVYKIYLSASSFDNPQQDSCIFFVALILFTFSQLLRMPRILQEETKNNSMQVSFTCIYTFLSITR